MSPLVISILAFVGVAALIAAVAMFFRDREDKDLEGRLDMLTGVNVAPQVKESLLRSGAMTEALDQGPTLAQAIVARFSRLRLLFEQADTAMTPTTFFVVSGGAGFLGAVATIVAGFTPVAAPIGALFLGAMPLMWLMWRRRKRMKTFASQLPDALELIARALRAGHSLASGFSLVREEMPSPIGEEFGRVFEEQNLGLPFEESMLLLTDRMPNLDLKFFSTAVILQRQTGGDLAEILDKIGYLVRERFKIWGQVQALTGEGRLSGVVLLALPPVLFIAVWRLNPDYVMTLFTDPMGKKMLAGAAVLQLLGALVIRKIINIKV